MRNMGEAHSHALESSISDKEIINYALGGIQKRLERERSTKAGLAAEGKQSPIADVHIARCMEQLSELGSAKTNDIQNFKSISELKLLYHAIHAILDILYGETQPAEFTAENARALKSQHDEINARIIKIELSKEKELDNMSKYDISARVNPLADQSGNVKAMASVNIDSAIGINDLTIVEGKNGLFVSYPQTKDKDGNFRDIVEFLKDEDGKMTKACAELKNAIHKTLVEMFKNGERATPAKEGQDKEPVMHDVKAFVTPLRNSQNATKGLATVQVGELFKIGSIRVNENSKTGENFVAMPSRPDKASESGYRDVVLPVNKEFAEKLRGAVLKQYDNQLAWKNRAADKEQPAQHNKPAANKSAQDIG